MSQIYDRVTLRKRS